MITNVFSFVLFLFLLISGFFETGSAVKITNLVVPPVTDTNRPVVLDCDYTLDADDGGLVVKWYFNNRNLVYQWISGHPPTAIGILKRRLNINYKADPADPNKYHRALFISNPTSELSGNYTCHVSTFKSEDVQTKPLIVLTQPEYFEIKEKLLGPRKFEISCEVKGVFPRPSLSLKLGDRDLTGLKIEVIPNQYIYDAKVTTVFYAKEDITEIECLVMVPEANYLTQKKSVITVKEEILDAAIASADIRRYAAHLLNLILLLVFIV
ncbi:unnamed protein product [Diabrotica balteata]|uniref:Ig-like domain-containing protein n=1 Tax=Diabrotica balteata TaxID=107213 RepID=A0A9P0E044_DIABA|nr:unnamed protein product [Diabrotica balteata]